MANYWPPVEKPLSEIEGEREQQHGRKRKTRLALRVTCFEPFRPIYHTQIRAKIAAKKGCSKTRRRGMHEIVEHAPYPRRDEPVFEAIN